MAGIIVTILVIFCTALVVTTAIAQWRVPNAMTRANLLGPAVGVAISLIMIAKLLDDWATAGFDLNDFIRAIITIFAVWIFASVGSYYMGRALYAVTVEDKED